MIIQKEQLSGVTFKTSKSQSTAQKRIRNAVTGVPNRFSENFRSANIKTRPRSESGRFVSASSPSLDASFLALKLND